MSQVDFCFDDQHSLALVTDQFDEHEHGRGGFGRGA